MTPSALPSFVMVDDFLTNPDDARAAALRLSYDPAGKAGNYSGVLSDRALPIPGLEDAASNYAGVPLQAAAGTSHGHCRLTLRGDRGITGPHVDGCDWSGILYLSRPEHCRGGTDFFRHKRTGLERVPGDLPRIQAAGYPDANALIGDVINRDTAKPSRWEKTFTAPMRYNRLILFNPWQFHDAAPAFGSGPQDGRLVLLLFLSIRQNC